MAREIAIESDMAEIEALWISLHVAIVANDRQAALRHFNPEAREAHAELFEGMGSEFSKMANTWSDFTPVSIGEEVAIYAFDQEESEGVRGYSVMFVRHPELGWLIQQW